LYTTLVQSSKYLHAMHTHLTLKVDCSGAGQESLVVGFLRSIRSHGGVVLCREPRKLQFVVGNCDGRGHVWLWCRVWGSVSCMRKGLVRAGVCDVAATAAHFSPPTPRVRPSPDAYCCLVALCYRKQQPIMAFQVLSTVYDACKTSPRVMSMRMQVRVAFRN
jgi:hypothetical protein